MSNNSKQLPTPQWVILSPMARWAQGPRAFTRQPEPHDPSTRTIPDDSFTIVELFERYKKGAPMPLGLERPISYGDGQTHNDLDLSRISRLDLVEVRDLATRVASTAEALQSRKAQLEAEAAQRKADNDNQATPAPTA
jgi:hypothetical protein